jgi:hypothetical protein
LAWLQSAARPSRHRWQRRAAVLDELREGDYPSRDAALALVAGLLLLEITDAVAEIVAAYVRDRFMPADPAGDDLHLALASYHRCDFLVIWNCQHLANANKFGHLRRVNTCSVSTSPCSPPRSNSWETTNGSPR